LTFIVPGVAQYTINGSYGGRKVANVVHMKIDTTGSVIDRTNAVNAMAGIVLNEWTDHLLPKQAAAYTAESVSFVDLDSADGSVGSRTQTAEQTWPKPGTGGTLPFPGNVALLVRKNLNGQRGVRKGRMYICGIQEADTVSPAQNELVAAAVTSWQTNMTNWFGSMNQTDQGPLGYNARLCIAHILTREPPSNPNKPWIPGNPLTGVAIEVTSLSVDKTLATQRRRLRS